MESAYVTFLSDVITGRRSVCFFFFPNLWFNFNFLKSLPSPFFKSKKVSNKRKKDKEDKEMTEAEPKPPQSPLPGSPEKEEPVATSQQAGALHDETSKERLIFSGEEFFLTSDPDIEVLDDENNTTLVSVSKAITDNGGIITNEVSCASNVIISPLNVNNNNNKNNHVHFIK